MNRLAPKVVVAVLVGGLLLVSVVSIAAPQAFKTANNCGVTAISRPFSQFERIDFSCLEDLDPNRMPPTFDTRVTLSCDGGPLTLYMLMPKPETHSLFLAQLNASLNAGKKFKKITYTSATATFKATLSDTCQEVQTFFALPATSTVNEVHGFEM